MALTTRKRIGEHLLEAGLVTKEQLQLAEREVRRTGELFGEVLVRLAFITADDLTMTLAQQAGMEGIIGKQACSLYLSERSPQWLKFKATRELDAVVGGYTAPRGSRALRLKSTPL